MSLMVLTVLPYLVQHIQYAITRGRQEAEADVAREQLQGAPDTASVYRAVAKVIAPTVVGIEVEQGNADEEADEWSNLFGPHRAVSAGSGVIVDATGDIITNYHVVTKAVSITVELSDGRTISEVDVVGADPLTDVAVLRVRSGGLTPAAWGDSDKMEVGDQVLAIGNPYGLTSTVTAGIISAKDRRGIGQQSIYQSFLQTDAAVNPGNSGGPLVNLKGEVIGINTAIFGHTYQGISFAIPSNIVHRVYEEIKAKGKVARGWLGVDLQELTPRLGRQFGVTDGRGALIRAVVPNSPAAQAGLEPGDIVVQWSGKPIKDADALRLAIADTPVGKDCPAVVVRDRQRMEVTVHVTERPAKM
jgi:serine protease Do